jgi:hypothetical protein
MHSFPVLCKGLDRRQRLEQRKEHVRFFEMGLRGDGPAGGATRGEKYQSSAGGWASISSRTVCLLPPPTKPAPFRSTRRRRRRRGLPIWRLPKRGTGGEADPPPVNPAGGGAGKDTRREVPRPVNPAGGGAGKETRREVPRRRQLERRTLGTTLSARIRRHHQAHLPLPLARAGNSALNLLIALVRVW